MKNAPILLVIGLLLLSSSWFSNSVWGQVSGKKPELVMYFHNAGPDGALPALQGDTIGRIKFMALAATNTNRTGASIHSFLEAAPSATFLPGNLVFRTGGGSSNRMIINSNGLVGIGTMNPLYHLHVVGNTHTSGRFYGRIHLDNDQQAVNSAPNTYTDEAYFERKQRSTLGVPAGLGNDYGAVLSLASGQSNPDHQLFFGDDGIFNRRHTANAANWGAAPWYKLLTGEDINGTENFVSKFTGPSTLGDSRLYDNGVNVGIGVGNAPDATFLLTVGGHQRLNGNLRATGNADIAGNTSVGGNLNVNLDAQVAGSIDVDANANVDGNLDVNGSFDVDFNATVDGTLNVGANANVDGSLDVDVNANVDGTLDVGANANVNGSLDVNGNGRVDGILIVGAPASTPGSHELYVDGSIIAEEVVVKLQGNWPDYVFADNYPLPNLTEWEQYIRTNRHLPGIPSAAQIAEQGGVEVGETQRLLLEKVEQLTLIVIEQQKQLDALKVALSNTQR